MIDNFVNNLERWLRGVEIDEEQEDMWQAATSNIIENIGNAKKLIDAVHSKYVEVDKGPGSYVKPRVKAFVELYKQESSSLILNLLNITQGYKSGTILEDLGITSEGINTRIVDSPFAPQNTQKSLYSDHNSLSESQKQIIWKMQQKMDDYGSFEESIRTLLVNKETEISKLLTKIESLQKELWRTKTKSNDGLKYDQIIKDLTAKNKGAEAKVNRSIKEIQDMNEYLSQANSLIIELKNDREDIVAELQFYKQKEIRKRIGSQDKSNQINGVDINAKNMENKILELNSSLNKQDIQLKKLRNVEKIYKLCLNDLETAEFTIDNLSKKLKAAESKLSAFQSCDSGPPKKEIPANIFYSDAQDTATLYEIAKEEIEVLRAELLRYQNMNNPTAVIDEHSCFEIANNNERYSFENTNRDLEINALEKELLDANTTIQYLEQKQQNSAQTDMRQQEIDKLQNEIDNCKTLINKKDEMLRNMEKDLKLSNSRCSQLSQQCVTALKDLEEITIKYSALNEELQNAKTKVNEKTRDDLEDRIENLEKQIMLSLKDTVSQRSHNSISRSPEFKGDKSSITMSPRFELTCNDKLMFRDRGLSTVSRAKHTQSMLSTSPTQNRACVIQQTPRKATVQGDCTRRYYINGQLVHPKQTPNGVVYESIVIEREKEKLGNTIDQRFIVKNVDCEKPAPLNQLKEIESQNKESPKIKTIAFHPSSRKHSSLSTRSRMKRSLENNAHDENVYFIKPKEKKPKNKPEKESLVEELMKKLTPKHTCKKIQDLSREIGIKREENIGVWKCLELFNNSRINTSR